MTPSPRRSRSAPRRAATAPPVAPRPVALAAAVALAGLHGLWALFQWTELAVARAGGEPFCPLGDAGACAALWDSPIAIAVQTSTGLPVAGWGLVWSVAAFALPLGVLTRAARGRTAPGAWAATLVTALAGLTGVLGLAAASLALGRLCGTCVLTYVLVLTYAALCFGQPGRLRGGEAVRGAVLAAAVALAAFLVLLVPGLRTSPAPQAASLVAPGTPAALGPEARPLAESIQALPPQARQLLADTLAAWARSAPVPLRPPRALLGPAGAPVRITEFSDVLCGHCAALHRVLGELRAFPDAPFALDARQFPLDAACNPFAARRDESPVRCLAARALICLEGHPDAFAFTGRLFAHQQELSEERIYELAAPLRSRAELAACVAHPETERKLQEDVSWAAELGIQGTPLVLVNDRPAANFPPLLQALVLARGDPTHPSLARLPTPSRGGEREHR